MFSPRGRPRLRPRPAREKGGFLVETWFNEVQTDHMRLLLRVKAVLHREQSEYQEIAVLDTYQYGRVLVLDNVLQTSEAEEFAYHEMMAHVPLFSHPDPRRVLIIGGGDGGTLREVLKHSGVTEAHLVEIDERVVAVAREFLPGHSSGFDDPRARIIFADGAAHAARSAGRYDVIIVDSTDPVGPAAELFREKFYRAAAAALRPGGIFVQQTESAFLDADRELIRGVQEGLSRIYPYAGMYIGAAPLYPASLWVYSIASHAPVGAEVPGSTYAERNFKQFNTRYYSPEVHRAAFALPPFVAELKNRSHS